LRGHKAPGFAICLVSCMAGAVVRIEVKRFLLDLFHRGYIPDVYGNELGDEDIDVRARIHNFLVLPALRMNVIAAIEMVTRGL
jgi:hypothetical protein